MFPAEFLSRYGRPVYRELTVTAGTPLVIGADPDRYLLGFMWTSDLCRIVPSSQLGAVTPAAHIINFPSPLIFTHALHGALVNLSWSVHAGFGDITVAIVEGFMKAPTPIRRIGNNGKAFTLPPHGDGERRERPGGGNGRTAGGGDPFRRH